MRLRMVLPAVFAVVAVVALAFSQELSVTGTLPPGAMEALAAF
jgi:hypothetical protein